MTENFTKLCKELKAGTKTTDPVLLGPLLNSIKGATEVSGPSMRVLLLVLNRSIQEDTTEDLVRNIVANFNLSDFEKDL